MDVPSGVTQEEGHTGFLHLPSAVLVLCTNELIVFHLLGISFFFRRKFPARVTSPRSELTSQRQKVSRLPNEPSQRFLL